MPTIDWDQLRNKLRQDVVILPHFFRNPIQTMRALPAWEWPTILVLQGAFAAATSLLMNLVARDLFGVITAIVIAPITNYCLVGITTGLFYYMFAFLFKNPAPFRQIYLHVLFASIPWMILTIGAVIVPPLHLLGSATFLLLLFVGFVETLQAPPIQLRKILLTLMGLHVIFWGVSQFQTTTKHKSMRQKATPESLDILEKELKTED